MVHRNKFGISHLEVGKDILATRPYQDKFTSNTSGLISTILTLPLNKT